MFGRCKYTSLKGCRYDVMFNELTKLHGENRESSARKGAMAGFMDDITNRAGTWQGSALTTDLSWLVYS